MTQYPMTAGRRPANRGPKAAAGNRAALISAAREIYATDGLDAPLSGIARRAGVGQAVLYRHFPDRDAIAAAVLEENVCQIAEARPWRARPRRERLAATDRTDSCC